MRAPHSLSLPRFVSIAALLACTASVSPALAAGVAPSAATPVQREQAQGRFLRGKELFGQKKFEAAMAEFQASYDIVTSPNTRLYVARCLRELNRTVAAYVELGRTAAEAKELAREDPKYEKTAQAANEERAALEPQLGFVQVGVAHAGPTTTLMVGGNEVRREAWNDPVPVAPGNADVVVETPGQAPVTRSVTLAAGEKKQVAIDATPETPPAETKPPDESASAGTGSSKQTMRTLAYVAGGVGVVGFLTFAFFGLKSNATFSDLQKACPNNQCPPGHESDISSGKSQQTVANVGLVFGILGAGAGVTLFLLSRDDKKPDAPTTGVALGPSWIGVKGAFR